MDLFPIKVGALAICLAASTTVPVAKADDQHKVCDSGVSLKSFVVHTTNAAGLYNKDDVIPYTGGTSAGIFVADGNSTLTSVANTPSLIKDIHASTASIASDEAKLFAFGPELTVADSNNILTKIECTPDGLKITADITRNGNIDPSLRSNSLWRPNIEASLASTNLRSISVEVEWIVHATEGGSLREWVDKKTIKFTHG